MGGTLHRQVRALGRRNPEVELLVDTTQESIYRGGPFWSTRVVFFFGLGPVIRLNDQLVGTDKMGHFLSQGWKYHKRHLRGATEDRVVRSGSATSRESSATDDRSLLERRPGGQLRGLPLLSQPLRGRHHPRQAGDHSNGWAPGLGSAPVRLARPRQRLLGRGAQPGLYDALLKKRVADHLAELCDVYSETPEAFVAPDDEELAERYVMLRLRDCQSLSARPALHRSRRTRARRPPRGLPRATSTADHEYGEAPRGRQYR